MNCRSCQTIITQDVKFCPNCGALVADNCTACGTKLTSNEKFCPNCGTASRYSSAGQPSGVNLSGQQGLSNLSRDLSNVSQDARQLVLQQVELSVNDTIDNQFRIEKKLGQGGYGGVYQAKDLLADKTLAIKVMPFIDKSSAKNILLEFETRNQIQDFEHIAKGYQPQLKVYQGQDIIVYPMELADLSLRDWMQANKGKHMEKLLEGLEYFRQACMGLAAIHKAGMVHLDVKPENVLLVKDNSAPGRFKVKITDFGLSRGFGMEHLEILQDGAGTALYMAPEQIQSARWQDVTKSADIYAMGLVLYELVDGTPSYSGSPQQIKQKKAQDIKPGKLKGEHEKYWKIIERAIRRDPDDRYPTIEGLLRDVERLLLGTVTSDDISCKKCGHVNNDTNLKYCEKCNNDLSDLFEPCSKCARYVRKDVDKCPGCGHDIGNERLYFIRKSRFEVIKDEDPVEAIELLEAMIKSSYKEKDGDEKLFAEVKSLRKKQEEISKLIEQANSPALMAQPEEALIKWEEVIKIFPRHRVAKKRIAELKKVISDLGSILSKAYVLGQQANFVEAKNVLENGLSAIPVKEPIREAIVRLDKNEKGYSAAMTGLQADLEAKRIHGVAKFAAMALAVAAESKEAKKNKDFADSLLENNNRLLRDASDDISKASFADAQAKIDKVLATQSDHKEADKIQKELNKVKSDYEAVFNEGVIHSKQGDLQKALHAFKMSLKLCKNSDTATKHVQRIEQSQRKVQELLDQVEKHLKSANFSKGRTAIAEIVELWKAYDVKPTESKLAETEKKYNGFMTDARSRYEHKRLGDAWSAAESALKVCPDSQDAKSLLHSLSSDRLSCENLISTSELSAKAADFTRAKRDLEKAQEIWINHPNNDTNKNFLAQMEANYNAAYTTAESNLRKRQFDEATKYAKKAIDICSASTAAKALLSKIQNEKSLYQLKKEQQSNLMKQTTYWLLNLAPGIAALLYFIFTSFKISVFGIDIPGIVGNIAFIAFFSYMIYAHFDKKSSIYWKLRYKGWFYGNTDAKLFFAFLGIVAFPVMLVAIFAGNLIALGAMVLYHLILINS